MTSFTVEFPDDIASQAARAGLLSSEALLKLIRRELTRANLGFFDSAKKLQELNLPVMSADEIQAEINAVRQAK
jgi:hypothetical protein